MAKLWTANKTWVSDSPNANTEYLVGAANGGCNYQSIPQGGTKRILVSNGANGNVAYGNRSVSLPEDVGNVQFPTQYNYVLIRVYLSGNSFVFSGDNYPIKWNNTNKRFEIDALSVPSTQSNSSMMIVPNSTSEPADLLEAVKKVKRFIFYKRDQDSGQLEVARYLTITDSSQWKYSRFSSYEGVWIDGDYIQYAEGTTSPLGPNRSQQPVYLLVPKTS